MPMPGKRYIQFSFKMEEAIGQRLQDQWAHHRKFKILPTTRTGIVEEALTAWFKRHPIKEVDPLLENVHESDQEES